MSLTRQRDIAPIAFDLPEIAALMSSLSVLGPSASESADSAMRKLATALTVAAVNPSESKQFTR